MTFQEPSAASEGRRVYVGNLLYSVTPADIETLLETAGLSDYDNIHISVDPVSGRNPGYCFVEFKTAETAAEALTTLNGVMVYDRPLRVGPCNPKSSTAAPPSRRQDVKSGGDRPTFERWGDWRGSAPREQTSTTTPPPQAQSQGPYGALQHLDDMRASKFQDGRRLYVGGLDRMIDQEHNDSEMRELFASYDIVAIGKRITPHPAAREKPGNQHYCFVDFASADEAQRAMQATHGHAAPGGNGGRLRVSLARGRPPLKDDPLGAEDVVEQLQQRGRSSYQPSSAYAGGRAAQEKQQRTNPDGAPSPARDPREEREEREVQTKEILAASSWRRG